ncbi:MAG: CPBP family intramembrane metalloprotease [Spirochaetaceae bacterium]|jgi:membrane protease YdiL (CAAX protease family)|nr:CPBP family intramembrane metalloprotease [Spirochaetaceae bacterium]
MDVNKKRIFSKALEFFLIILILALPPLLTQRSEPEEIAFTIPGTAVTAGICIGLLLLCGRHPLQPRSSAANRRNIIGAALLSLAVFTALLASMLSIQFLSARFHIKQPLPVTVTTAPDLLFAVGTLVSACYEEILYRWYLPLTGETIVSQGTILKGLFPKQAAIQRIPELLPILLFAPAHWYLGAPAVINACIAGILLRILVQKTGTPFIAAGIHWVYNVLIYSLISHY